jgi:hypothetical protein
MEGNVFMRYKTTGDRDDNEHTVIDIPEAEQQDVHTAVDESIFDEGQKFVESMTASYSLPCMDFTTDYPKYMSKPINFHAGLDMIFGSGGADSIISVLDGYLHRNSTKSPQSEPVEPKALVEEPPLEVEEVANASQEKPKKKNKKKKKKAKKAAAVEAVVDEAATTNKSTTIPVSNDAEQGAKAPEPTAPIKVSKPAVIKEDAPSTSIPKDSVNNDIIPTTLSSPQKPIPTQALQETVEVSSTAARQPLNFTISKPLDRKPVNEPIVDAAHSGPKGQAPMSKTNSSNRGSFKQSSSSNDKPSGIPEKSTSNGDVRVSHTGSTKTRPCEPFVPVTWELICSKSLEPFYGAVWLRTLTINS